MAELLRFLPSSPDMCTGVFLVQRWPVCQYQMTDSSGPLISPYPTGTCSCWATGMVHALYSEGKQLPELCPSALPRSSALLVMGFLMCFAPCTLPARLYDQSDFFFSDISKLSWLVVNKKPVQLLLLKTSRLGKVFFLCFQLLGVNGFRDFKSEPVQTRAAAASPRPLGTAEGCGDIQGKFWGGKSSRLVLQPRTAGQSWRWAGDGDTAAVPGRPVLAPAQGPAPAGYCVAPCTVWFLSLCS